MKYQIVCKKIIIEEGCFYHIVENLTLLQQTAKNFCLKVLMTFGVEVIKVKDFTSNMFIDLFNNLLILRKFGNKVKDHDAYTACKKEEEPEIF